MKLKFDKPVDANADVDVTIKVELPCNELEHLVDAVTTGLCIVIGAATLGRILVNMSER